MPSHIDEFLLIGNHVILIVLLNLEKHFVLKHPMKASLHNSVLVSIHYDIHGDFNCLAACLARITVESNFL